MAGIRELQVTSRCTSRLVEKYDGVAEEVPVAIVYNGVSQAVMMATPIDLEDFALGFSLTEGIVQTPDQVLSVDLTHSELGIELKVQILASCFDALKRRRRQISGRSGCGLCGLESLEALAPSVDFVPKSAIPSQAKVVSAIEQMKASQFLQQACGAVHCAALINASGSLELLREDVGRHNALDKLIGALNRPLEKEDFFLLSSRASYELVIKAAKVACSSLVTISAPTSMAVSVSKQAGMNLIGFIREDRQIIYHCATSS